MGLCKNLTAQAVKALNKVDQTVQFARNRMKQTTQLLQRQLFPPPPPPPAQKPASSSNPIPTAGTRKLGPALKPVPPQQAFKKAAQRINAIVERAKKTVTKQCKSAGQQAAQIERYAHNKIEKAAAAKSSLISGVAASMTPQTMMASTFFMAKDSSKDKIQNTTNTVSGPIYLNVGAWDEDSSDFGLVCGRHVLQCSWMDPGGLPAQELPSTFALNYAPDYQSQAALKAFFKHKWKDKLFCIRYQPASDLLTENPEDIRVFVGDLHLHLFPGSRSDNFKRESGTLSAEFQCFLQHATDKLVKGIVQLGDCFEVWESQIIMDTACDELLKAKRYTEVLKGSGTTIVPLPLGSRGGVSMAAIQHCQQQAYKSVLDAVPHLVTSPDAIRSTFLTKASPADAVKILNALGMFSCAQADTKPLNLTDPIAIETAIKTRYPQIKWELFTRYRGNHDNGLKNPILIKKYALTNTIAEARDSKPACDGELKKKGIAVEHGHCLDKSNADGRYTGFGRGYWWTEMNTHTREYFDGLGSVQGETEKCRDDLRKDSDTRLIILGHSHSAKIEIFDPSKRRFVALNKLKNTDPVPLNYAPSGGLRRA